MDACIFVFCQKLNHASHLIFSQSCESVLCRASLLAFGVWVDGNVSTVFSSVCIHPASVTESHRLVALNKKHLFLIVPEAEKSNIQALTYSVPGERAHFLDDRHLAVSSPGGKGKNALWSLF